MNYDDAVMQFVNYLNKQKKPVLVATVLRQFKDEDWLYCKGTSKDRQRRTLREVKEYANEKGIPICSHNDGYYMGRSREEVMIAANRHMRHGNGAIKQGQLMMRIAERLPSIGLPFEEATC